MPQPGIFKSGTNPCEGAKLYHADPTANDGSGDFYFANTNCTGTDSLNAALEQSGTNVTVGYQGDIDTSETETLPNRQPITTPYWQAGLCPVNVHWHLGAEHLSVGEFDENGVGPAKDNRRLAADARLGFRCHYYDATDPKYTTEYNWQHCVDMHVGETYEIHWPHSADGLCGTPWQYQSPFYDGVFCTTGKTISGMTGGISLDPLNTFERIGVQAQIFTIVNDENYYHPNLIRGMLVDGDYGADITKYTGSTTGTTRSNEICSKYTPITWQVDRKCHIISASSFDKMCADMKEMADDMSMDFHAHGARELVLDEYAANNHANRRA